MDVKSRLASNMRNQVLKQYKLNETKRELKKKDSKITSIIYYNNEQNVLVGYNNGKLKRAENLSAVKAGNLTDTTIKKDGERLSPVQINDMNKTYRQIWQFEGETYGVKPGKIERLENGGGDITNIGDVKGWDPEFQSKLEIFQMINKGYDCPDISKNLYMTIFTFWNSDGSGDGADMLTPNTPLLNGLVSNSSFQLILDLGRFNKNELSIYNILSTINNEKRDRMLKVFNMPRSFGYELVDKSKRMEMGYYCKDKKVFKTHFDNKKFISNEKMINTFSDLYNDGYIMFFGGNSHNDEKTIWDLIKSKRRKDFSPQYHDNSLAYRYFQKIKDYLTGNDNNRFALRFIVAGDKDYSGGGVIKTLGDEYEDILNIVLEDNIRYLRTRLILSKPDFNDPDWSSKLYYYTNSTYFTDYYNDKESIFNDECLNIRYTLDLLNHTVGVDSVNVRKGNIINEPLGYNHNYVIRNYLGIYTPLITMFLFNTQYTNWIGRILNYKMEIYDGIISMVESVSYNTTELDKWLNGPNN